MEQLRLAELLHHRVSLWTMDEHRIGLKPILRRVWAPTGQPLIQIPINLLSLTTSGSLLKL